MAAWFIWNGVDSRDMNIWVTDGPQPTRAAERTKEVTILGRAGTLLLKQGDNVHDGYLKECAITVPFTADMQSILNWLHGSGEVIFSSEPGYVYRAEIPNELKFSRSGNSLRTASVPFFVHPHKGQFPPETAVEFSEDGEIYNPGTVAARPLIEVTFTGECSLTVGDITLTLSHTENQEAETVTVDCDAQIITDDNGIWQGTSEGDFWLIEPGTSEITLTDAEITILPRWRWY